MTAHEKQFKFGDRVNCPSLQKGIVVRSFKSDWSGRQMATVYVENDGPRDYYAEDVMLAETKPTQDPLRLAAGESWREKVRMAIGSAVQARYDDDADWGNECDKAIDELLSEVSEIDLEALVEAAEFFQEYSCITDHEHREIESKGQSVEKYAAIVRSAREQVDDTKK